MAVDINALVEKYIKDNPNNTPQQALVALVAVGQEENFKSGKIFRWPKLTDIAGTKWSVALFNEASNLQNLSVNIINSPLNGINLGATGKNAVAVGFGNNARAVNTEVAAVETHTSPLQTNTNGLLLAQ